MKKNLLLSILFLLFLSVGLCVWGLNLPFPFPGAPDPYCVMNVDPSVSWGASGTYTYYVKENTITEPAHPNPIPVSVSGNARGLGWVYITISSIAVDGENTMDNPEAGIAPRDDIGFSGYSMSPLGNIPFSDAVDSDDFSFSINGANWRKTPKTYEWNVSAEVVLTGIDWQGDDWVADPETRTSYNPEGSGTWIIESSNVCSICKQTGLSSPTAHYVNPCPNAGCQEGGWYWKCFGIPSSHALLTTCSGCNASSVYACSGHPDSCSSGSTSGSYTGSLGGYTGSPDNTPDCPDCMSHCSSPCSCTNSGTCNGSIAPPSTPPSSPSTPPSSPTLVECDYNNCTEMVSSPTQHRKGCGSGEHYYWPGCPNNTNWWSKDSTHEEKTCRYGTCGQRWYRCVTPTPYCSAPNRQGKKCWAL